MFGHNHYVPILKGKRAEFPALAQLESKHALTPLIEAVPSQPPTAVPKQMAKTWYPPYFLDVVFFDDESADPKCRSRR